MEALGGHGVNGVTGVILDIEFLATAQTSGRPAGMPAGPFSGTDLLTILINGDFGLAKTNEGILADRNLVGSVRGDNREVRDLVVIFVFSEGFATEKTETTAWLFNDGTDGAARNRNEFGVTDEHFVFVSFFVTGNDF